MLEHIKYILKLQIFKFAVAGAFCACIEFAIFAWLIDLLPYQIANIISIIIAVSINYVLSRSFVFEKGKLSQQNEILSFILFSILALLLNQLILWFLVEFIKLEVHISKVTAIIIVSVFSYVTKKHIVFRTS